MDTSFNMYLFIGLTNSEIQRGREISKYQKREGQNIALLQVWKMRKNMSEKPFFLRD